MPLEQARALVRREWEAAGDAAAANGAPLKSRHVAGLLALFLGFLGVHRMYLGNVSAAIVLPLFFVFTFTSFFGIPSLIIGVIEGIMLLQNSTPSYARDARGVPLGD
jgi:TM2 domain-containing membrane protein YozV